MPIVYDSLINDRCSRWPNISSFPRRQDPFAGVRFHHEGRRGRNGFRRIRWADTNGEPVCPHCGGVDAYDCRRLKGAPVSAAGPAARISRSRPARCSPATSCRCAAISPPSRSSERGQGQVGAGPVPRSRRLLQVRFRVAAQTARSDGRGIEGPHDRRRGQGGGSRWRLFRRLCQARQPRENRRDRRLLAINPASARPWS